MKNYYNVLGVTPFEDSQDVILAKYKEATARLGTKVIDDSVKNRLIETNEAFLVLSDVELKKQYDYALSSGTESVEIVAAIAEKRAKAIKFINSRLDGSPKKKKKKFGIAAIICTIFILGAIGNIVKSCVELRRELAFSEAVAMESYSTTADWTEYDIANAFSLSIPNTMEQCPCDDEYYQNIMDSNPGIEFSEVIFQQKGLSAKSSEAYNTYARVIAKHFPLSSNEAVHHDQTFGFNEADYRDLNEMAEAELDIFSFIDEPEWRWIDIDGTKAIEGSYRRTGYEGPVNCKIYLLYNYNEIAKIVVAYREKDSNRWADDISNVIRTFKWNNPK